MDSLPLEAKVKEILSCRSCDALELESVLDLGALHINAFPLPGESDGPKVPLHLVVCGSCKLLQLTHTVDPDLLYRKFWYRSGITETMRKALRSVAEDTKERVDLLPGDLVVDIGSNDSTLLREMGDDPDITRIGFEPATNLMGEARDGGLEVVNDYFSLPALRVVTGQKAKIIFAIAMFYDLDEPNKFVRAVADSLEFDGVFVIQMAYLAKMLTTNDVGNICHEHLEYYSLASLEELLNRHGLYVFDVQENSVNGGSIRVYASKDGRLPSVALHLLRAYESATSLTSRETLSLFAERVRRIRLQVRDLVRRAEAPFVYGASTKGNTLLQYWELGSEHLAGAAERDPLKWGRETVGTRIPIVSERVARERAKTFLVLPWHFREEILAREAACLWKGDMIFPLPYPEVVQLR